MSKRAGLPITLLSALALAGCSAPLADLPNASDFHIDRSEVSAIAQRLNCESTQEIRDDVYFFDPMTGVECINADGTTTLLRVYERPQSPGQVLESWAGYFDESNQLIVGENWFAIGGPTHLLKVAEVIGVSAELKVTPPSAAPITAEQYRLRECSVAVVTITRETVFDSVADPEMAGSYEPFFAGIIQFSDGLATAIGESGTFNNAGFEYMVAAYGDRIKEFCSRTRERLAP